MKKLDPALVDKIMFVVIGVLAYIGFDRIGVVDLFNVDGVVILLIVGILIYLRWKRMNGRRR